MANFLDFSCLEPFLNKNLTQNSTLRRLGSLFFKHVYHVTELTERQTKEPLRNLEESVHKHVLLQVSFLE